MQKNQVEVAKGTPSPPEGPAPGWGGPRSGAGRKRRLPLDAADVVAAESGEERVSSARGRRARRMPFAASVRLSGEGVDAVRAASAATGLAMSRFMRIAALERATARLAVIEPGERKLLVDLLGTLRRQGANLNQYAFAANKVAAALNRESVMPATRAVEETAADVQAAVERLQELLMPLEERLRAGRPGGRR